MLHMGRWEPKQIKAKAHANALIIGTLDQHVVGFFFFVLSSMYASYAYCLSSKGVSTRSLLLTSGYELQTYGTRKI